MLYLDSHNCPRCGGESMVYRTHKCYRWRKCLDVACDKRWRTTEIHQDQADDLEIWYHQQERLAQPAVQEMLRSVCNTITTLRKLTFALGLEVEEDDNATDHNGREPDARESAAA